MGVSYGFVLIGLVMIAFSAAAETATFWFVHCGALVAGLGVEWATQRTHNDAVFRHDRLRIRPGSDAR